MTVIESEKYKRKLENIADYIAQDKKNAARKFLKDLKKQINNLTRFPYKYRKFYYFNDENIRDMVFKGYTIIYKIENDKIIVLDIFKKEQYDNI